MLGQAHDLPLKSKFLLAAFGRKPRLCSLLLWLSAELSGMTYEKLNG